MLAVHDFTLDTLTGQIGGWFAGAPFHRLRLTSNVSEFEWNSLDGPHLAKLTELRFDQLSEATAALAARSEHLRGLAALNVSPLDHEHAVLRQLLTYPTRAGLRSFTLGGVTPPHAIRTLAERCKLEALDSFSFGIDERPEWPPALGLTGVIGTMISEMLMLIRRGAIEWAEYWPALTELARSPVLPRLSRLQMRDADIRAGTLADPDEPQRLPGCGNGLWWGRRPRHNPLPHPGQLRPCFVA